MELGVDPSRPVPFSIDLNETPSPPPDSPPLDAYSLVFSFHGAPPPAPGLPAPFPGETGVGAEFACRVCDRAETRGGTVVCDGCEQGFHLECVGIRSREVGEWVCGVCRSGGVGSRRWRLGAVQREEKGGSVRGFDINESPPAEFEGEDLYYSAGGSRKPTQDGDHYGYFASPFSLLEIGYNGNGVGSATDYGCISKKLRRMIGHLPPEELTEKSAENSFMRSTLERIHPFNIRIGEAPDVLQQETCLQRLREFISDRKGYLGDGWHVEFKQWSNQYGPCALYCSPDGKRFETMFDVACYLGLTSNSAYTDVHSNDDSLGVVKKSSSSRKRRKELARLSRATSLVENKGNVQITFLHEASTAARVKAYTFKEDNICSNLNIELPIQFEDFFVTCLGKIDQRPAYHCPNQIWPLGYMCSWHDQITGSLFECVLSDGGARGPVFRVKRRPCSLLPVPIARTVLFAAKSEKPAIPRAPENDTSVDKSHDGDQIQCDEDDQIQMLLSDPNPIAQDLFSCLSNNTSEDSKASFNLDCSSIFSGSGDKIGEFFIEGCSSSSVWTMVSQAFVEACRKVYKESHSLQFSCSHSVSSKCRFPSDGISAKTRLQLGLLSRFCHMASPTGIKKIIENEIDLEATCKSISEWLDQDRFGLDMEFVQEVVELLPRAETCSNYQFLKDRNHTNLHTVANGMLVAKRTREAYGEDEVIPYDSYTGRTNSPVMGQPSGHLSGNQRCPPGQPLRCRLPSELVGDALQIWEFFCRFYEILGLREPLSFEELESEIMDPWFHDSSILEEAEKKTHERQKESAKSQSSMAQSDSSATGDFIFIQVETESMKEAAQTKVASRTYPRCSGVALTKAHISLLKVLVSELQTKLAVFADPSFDAGDLKPRRGRRKEADNSAAVKKLKIDLLPINELTWPELARRYVLAVAAMDCNMDSADISIHKGAKMYRCLQGDGGILCGSLTGVASMEADALLFAEAGRRISDSTKPEHEIFHVEYMDSEAVTVNEPVVRSDVLPEWAQVLEPVRKLPTNVGTRIRRCIYESLEKGPPAWARRRLEHSISKEVYKGNASGPTKKAVLSVLAEVRCEISHPKPEKRRKVKRSDSLSNVIMKQCRIVLRQSVSADEAKVFCNLLGTTLLSLNDNDDEGILGSSGMVSRPLDFRTVDLRLTVGAYGGSHEVFLEDVREVWHIIRAAYGDRPDLMELAETLSQNFESLYEKEVLSLVQNFTGKNGGQTPCPEVQKRLDNLLCADEMPKAPWEEGVCKVCGIDKDDDSVLLCDTCDSEYHTYCLNPPLSKIPAGNWYCPSCVAGPSKAKDLSYQAHVNQTRRRRLGKEICNLKESLGRLASSLEENEYWDLKIEERIFLLKFLCDEVLNSVVIREHLDQCADMSTDLQHRLRSAAMEWRNLKFKEATMMASISNENRNLSNGVKDGAREEVLDARVAGLDTSTVHQQYPPKASNTGKFLGNSETKLSISKEQSHVPNESMDCDIDQHSAQIQLSSKMINHANGDITSSNLCNGQALSGCKDPDQASSSLDEFQRLEKVPSSTVTRKAKSSEANEQDFVIPHGQDNIEVNVQKTTVNVQSKSCSTVSRRNVTNLEEGETGESAVPLQKVDMEEKAAIAGNSAVSIPLDEMSHLDYSNPPRQGTCSTAMNLTDSESYLGELDSLKNDISGLEDSIAHIESQFLMTSSRREFLGRDSSGRIFWSVSRPGKRPWLLVDGSVLSGVEYHDGFKLSLSSQGICLVKKRYPPCNPEPYSYGDHDLSIKSSNLSPWIVYESDTDILELTNWLSDSDPREKELKDCLLQWQRLRSYQAWNQLGYGSQTACNPEICKKGVYPSPFHCLLTKAYALLEQRYGPCLELEISDIPKKRSKKSKANHEAKMYRCECLEPIWPSKAHCLSCHQTFTTGVEFQNHNEGSCRPNAPGPDEEKEEGNLTGKGTSIDGAGLVDEQQLHYGNLDMNARLIRGQKKACPYSIEDVSRSFITKSSNMELVQDIGFIGSDGMPLLTDKLPSCVGDSLLLCNPNQEGYTSVGTSKAGPINPTEEFSIASRDAHRNESGHSKNSPETQRYFDNGASREMKRVPPVRLQFENDEVVTVVNTKKLPKLNESHNFIIPESSLRLVSGRIFHILKRLKINLLDMDSALPDEALRQFRASSLRRRAWRAFVKTAESIYEMVQATILFEDMIKTEYLRNEWWYWSSLTAAAKTSTISSLALRIYSLDASIIYSKEYQCDTDVTDNLKPLNKILKKRKDMDGVS